MSLTDEIREAIQNEHPLIEYPEDIARAILDAAGITREDLTEWKTAGVVTFSGPGPATRGASLVAALLDLAHPEDARPALAALCLHGHPQGFTWEDVGEIMAAADDVDGADVWPRRVRDKRVARLHDLADRIAALLPPEDTP